MKNIVLLGSTGSIGENTLSVIRRCKDEFKVVGLAACSDSRKLFEQASEFGVKTLCLFDETKRAPKGRGVKILRGREGLEKIASLESADLVVVAMSSGLALLPLMAAIRSKKTIALANKESLVMAGDIVMEEVRKHRVTLVPIDSEQNAIFQCCQERPHSEIRRVYLTASGGPFRGFSKGQLAQVRPRDALKHPRWKMGKKITVDSSTFMNKGLEVIEARWLFDLRPEQIKVVVHKESVIHSFVEFIDGSMLAQLGVTDMRLPIQHALAYPKRLESRHYALDLFKTGALTFEEPDFQKFRCLGLSYRALEKGGLYPCVLNAANEVCVEAFLNNRIRFLQISEIVEKMLSKKFKTSRPDLSEIWETDRIVKEEVSDHIRALKDRPGKARRTYA